MVLFLLLLLIVFSFQPKQVLAYSANNIPIFYQLIQAYEPTNGTAYLSNPAYTFDQVLGVSTSVPVPVPANIGGGESGDMIVIAVLGDSMIDTLGEGIPQLQKSLSAYFPGKKIKILNYGFGSSTMEYALTRLTSNYQYKDKNIPSLISQLPDIVVIESFAYNNFGNTQTGFDKQSTLITKIIDTIHEKLPKTSIMLTSTIAPNSLIFANGSEYKFNSFEKIERTTTIKNYLEKFYNYAQNHHLPFADAYHSSLVKNEGERSFINTTDNIHPSTYGGEFFCDTLAKALFDNHLIP